MKILLTGATGFIGSHLVRSLHNKGYELFLTRRHSSNMSRCYDFKDKVIWGITDNDLWIDEAIKFYPDLIIHAAWNGVNNVERDDWNIQLSNICFFYKLFQIIEKANVQKIICLGSQAEYGQFDGYVSEEYKICPMNSYGIVKLANLELLKSFSLFHSLQWYWLRIFSILGENDNVNWLLPSVVAKLKRNESIALTLGEQKYDYLYIEDLNDRILKVVETEESKSGIYNICSGQGVRISDFLCLVANQLGKSIDFLRFGELPYRPNQTMCMVGNPTKFNETFGELPFYTIKEILNKIL